MLRNWIGLLHDWKFLRDDAPDAWGPTFDDSAWETVSVPHCFNAADTCFQRGYYRGAAWYRRALPGDLPGGARVELAALGSFAVTHVWLNGTFVGKYMGGYTGFTANLTPHLRRGRNNVLALRVTNLHNPDVLPGLDSPDYNLYGGIYREIGLRVSNPLHIPDRGITIATPSVSEERGTVHLNVVVENDRRSRAQGTLSAEIRSPEGKIVSGRDHEFVVAPGSERLVTIPVPAVDKPDLWSPEHPALYNVTVRVSDSSGLIDEQSLHFGFRWFRFDEDKGFFINGKGLKLRGMNRHQDYPGLGNALPASFQEYDVRLLKEAGANFVRCSHYPMHPAFLDACDRLGVLVYEEIASWQYIGGSAFQDNAVQMMKEMIARDRRHPSIILWGLLNEGRNTDFFCRLNDTAHRYDPSRLTVYADNSPEEGLKLGTVRVPDVLGLNYKVPHLDELRSTLKGLKLINSEHTNANTGERIKPDGTRFTDAESMIWQMERILGDLDEFDKREWMAGSALWCMHDYGTDYEPSWPIQKSGAFDAWRIPKLVAYGIRARWTNDPFVRIAEHWTCPGEEGKARQVVVISNCDETELLLNGRSLGKRKWYDGYTWETTYEPGSLVAVGRHGGAEHRDERRTAGQPAKLVVEPLDAALPAEGTDITLLTVMVVDREGVPVPGADGLTVRFRPEGGATLFGLGGRAEVTTRSGVGRIALRASRTAGIVTVTAECDGLEPGEARITMK